jgi:glycosyltransferase involved in cell wall biosynthesis
MPSAVPVVYLIDSLGPGGAQRQLVELVKRVDRALIAPTVVVYYDIPHFRRELEAAGVDVHVLRKRDRVGVSFLTKLARFLRGRDVALVHSFLVTPNVYARLVKALGLVRCIVTSERNVSIADRPARLFLERRLWRLSDRIIANAEGVREVLIARAGVDRERVRVVHNGIDVEKIGLSHRDKIDAIRRRVLPGGLGFLVGLVGRICPQKGHRFLIEALPALHRAAPGTAIRFAFWGEVIDAGYLRSLESRIEVLGLSADVHFMGLEQDIASVLAACDCVVLPSLWEGFPNALLEAMAAARPVVATRIVDNHRIVEDGVTGFLVAPGASEELAERIGRIVTMSAGERMSMGMAARTFVGRHYGVDRMVEGTLAVYRELGLFASDVEETPGGR